jgi:hypothetical protein
MNGIIEFWFAVWEAQFQAIKKLCQPLPKCRLMEDPDELGYWIEEVDDES